MTRWKKITLLSLLLTAAGLAMGACSAVSILNATIPRSGYQLHRDIAYGGDARQKLDIYVPDGVHDASRLPVIVFFYGGSWKTGSKNDYLFVGQSFATKGYITVIADYRLYPQVSFPDFLHDSANAFRFVHNHIAKYGGNPESLFLAGHSAGAYNAVMLAVNHEYLRAAGAKAEWIRGVIAISGPYDFLPLSDETLIKLFSTAVDIRHTQPITFVNDKPYPPVFLATGDSDVDVLPRNSIILATRLKQLQTPVETHLYPNIDHIDIMLSLAHRFQDKTTLREDIAKFINGITASEDANTHQKRNQGHV